MTAAVQLFQPVPVTGQPPAAPAMQKAARAFESVFVGELVSLMMSQVSTEGPFGGGHAEETWRGMLAEEMGKSISNRGGLGLAPHILRQMIEMQGTPPAAGAAPAAPAMTAADPTTTVVSGPGTVAAAKEQVDENQ